MRALVFGAYAVFPAITRYKVASGVANGGDSELPDKVDDILPEAGFVGDRVPGLVYAGVDAATKMLDERAKQSVLDGANFKVVVYDKACREMVLLIHGIPFARGVRSAGGLVTG